MGIVPQTDATMVHDPWEAYYSYENKVPGLCNSHHIGELTAAQEEGQKWAQPMTDFLVELNSKVDAAGGQLGLEEQQAVRRKYRQILKRAETECPPPLPNPPGKRGRVAKSKTRNLIERLRDYEDDTLRFMTDTDVPFTNNHAERDLRMTKVQQKISGCFHSWEGAKIFCRIRSYLSTCAKHNVSAADALNLLFDGRLPDFVGNVSV
jgi:transposase